MPVTVNAVVWLILDLAGSKLEQKFSLVGFKDWKHATGKGDVLSRHDSCCAHTQKKSSFMESIYKMNSHHNPSLIGSEYVGLNNLHKIGITSEHLLKLSSSVAIKILHFVVILKMKIP